MVVQGGGGGSLAGFRLNVFAGLESGHGKLSEAAQTDVWVSVCVAASCCVEFLSLQGSSTKVPFSKKDSKYVRRFVILPRQMPVPPTLRLYTSAGLQQTDT